MEMQQKKIVLAGGSGFIGRYLAAQYRNMGYRVIIITRSVLSAGNTDLVTWDDTDTIREALKNAEMVINLAGKSVNCRYNEKNKSEILRSRVETTKTLGHLIGECTFPPKLWINAGTATIYRHAEDRPMTEEKGEIGSGFSVNVATEWEKTFFSFSLPAVRQVALRITIVLGKEAEVIRIYRNLVKYGLGGKQGKGTQRFSWIHVHDLFRLTEFIRSRPELSGVINAAAPNPVNNQVFMKTFRQLSGTVIALPSPAWMLKTGAAMMGTETELVLKSRWVIPERLLRAGFTFRYDTIDSALKDILAP